MGRVDAIIAQLDLLNERAKRSPKNQISEQDSRKIFDEVCLFFPKATPDERVDIQIAFEGRDSMVEALMAYLNRLVQQVSKLVQRDKRDEGQRILQEALTADAILDGRTDMDVLHKLQNQLLEAGEVLHFDVASFLEKLETTAGMYVQRAQHYHKQQKRIHAVQALGRAIQLDHRLRENSKITEFATLLTSQASYSAIMTLEDPFLRNSFVAELERKERARKTTMVAGVVKDDATETSLLQRVFGVFSGKR